LLITAAMPRPLPAARALPAGDEAAVSVAAQSGRNLERPPTWRARYDEGAEGAREHLVMRPGWHINPGPAGIFWDEGRFAAGNYSISSTIFLFPEGSGTPPAQVETPYGLLFGGEDLDGAAPAYLSFMVRNDGAFRVARHGAGSVTDVVPWTMDSSIVRWAEGFDGTVENVLAVDVTDTAVTFWVNDQQVASAPRAELQAEGVVGLRVGEGLSLHVTDIVIGPNRR
jgi:hypothetical protein